jgi:succinoglycan biosynthesis transport protein ExoP
MSSTDPHALETHSSARGKLRYGWLNTLALGMIVGGLAAGATWLFMPEAKHTAHTWITINRHPSQQGNDTEEDFADFQRSQVALAKSRVVLNRAMRDHSILKNAACLKVEGVDPVEVLASQLVVDFDVRPTIMQISIAGDNEVELKEIVEAVADAYIVETEAFGPTTLRGLEERRQKASENLKKRQNELNGKMRFGNNNDRISTRLRRKMVEDQFLAAQEQLHKTQAKKRESTSALQVEQAREHNRNALLPLSASTIGYMCSPIGGPIERVSLLANLVSQTEAIDELDVTETTKSATASLKRQVRYEKLLLNTVQAAVTELAVQLEQPAPGANENQDLADAQLIVANAEELFKKADAELEWYKLHIGPQRRIHIMESEKGVVVHGHDLKPRAIATSVAGAGGFLLVLLGVGIIEFRNRKIESVG